MYFVIFDLGGLTTWPWTWKHYELSQHREHCAERQWLTSQQHNSENLETHNHTSGLVLLCFEMTNNSANFETLTVCGFKQRLYWEEVLYFDAILNKKIIYFLGIYGRGSWYWVLLVYHDAKFDKKVAVFMVWYGMICYDMIWYIC